jgi:hypothetical protein
MGKRFHLWPPKQLNNGDSHAPPNRKIQKVQVPAFQYPYDAKDSHPKIRR